jgi:antitoxin (DNA-binding transcriptional repressor) of toxin-antitoxin stability system
LQDGRHKDQANGMAITRTVDIQEAQEELEELIDDLKPGDWFEISVDGRARVRVLALSGEELEALALIKRPRKKA